MAIVCIYTQVCATGFARAERLWVFYSGGREGVAREEEGKTFSYPWETCKMTSPREFVQMKSLSPTPAYRSVNPFTD